MAISSANFVNLIGNLGGDPETRTFTNGNTVTQFSLATNITYTDRDGNRVTNTEWHRVKAFGKTGEILQQYLKRGSKVSILGSIRYNKWVDKYEQNRISTEIIVESFQFLDSRPEGGQRVSAGNTSSYTTQESYPPVPSRPQAVRVTDERDMPSAEKSLPF